LAFSKDNSLHLIERYLVIAPIVEFGRFVGARMRGHFLRVFEQPVVLEVDGNAGSAE
jgi:hypothetical protein